MTDDDLKSLFVTHSAEIRRHFDVTAERMEKRGFADTQAMIKFSHAELDRRVRTLEESQRSLQETVANLAARVDRLENSTH